jgi:hypothetical protein
MLKMVLVEVRDTTKVLKNTLFSPLRWRILHQDKAIVPLFEREKYYTIEDHIVLDAGVKGIEWIYLPIVIVFEVLSIINIIRLVFFLNIGYYFNP